MKLFKRVLDVLNIPKVDISMDKLTQNAVNEFAEEYFLPIIKHGEAPAKKVVATDGEETMIPDELLPAYKPIEETGLSIILGIDKGSYFSWLIVRDLKSNLNDTIKAAYKNLLSKSNLAIADINDASLQNAKVGMLVGTFNLAASFIIVAEVWEEIFTFCSSTDIIFIIPNQDKFLFCSSADLTAVKFLKEVCPVLFSEQPKPISENLYSFKKHGIIEKMI